MANTNKQGIDYFPLDCNTDDKIALIEAVHGLEGFAVVIKLWQKIYFDCGYYYNVDEMRRLLFSKAINVDINRIDVIILDCLKWGIFNQEKYDNFCILTSRGIQKRYFDIVKRRKSIDVVREYLLIEDESILDNVNINWIDANINHKNVDINLQKKRKEKKVNRKESTAASKDASYRQKKVLITNEIKELAATHSIDFSIIERWIAYRKKLRKPVKTDSGVKGFIRSISASKAESGLSYSQLIERMEESEWMTIKPEYLSNGKNGNGNGRKYEKQYSPDNGRCLLDQIIYYTKDFSEDRQRKYFDNHKLDYDLYLRCDKDRDMFVTRQFHNQPERLKEFTEDLIGG